MTEKEREQLSARIEKTSEEIFLMTEKMSAGVPELTEEEIQIGIQQILARCDHKKDQG